MKNKKLYLSFFFFVLFIVNTMLVNVKVFDNLDSIIHGYIIRIHSEISTNVMNVITFFGSTLWIILLTIFIIVGFVLFKRKFFAFATAGMIIISTIINNVIKIIIQRPRPVYMTVKESSYSYPSGHTMAAATLYGLIIYYIIKSQMPKKYKWLFSIGLSLLIVLIGISRIYLGAHYFSDIIGGLMASAGLLFLFSYIQDEKNILKQP